MDRYLIFIFFGCIICVASAATDYCSKACTNENGEITPHIGCNNNNKFADTCPPDAAVIPFDDNIKDILVDVFNFYRNEFATGVGNLPHACRMATIDWDEELADLAGLTVKRCKLDYDYCHNTDKFHYSGQNIVLLSPPRKKFNVNNLMIFAVASWFSKSREVLPTTIKSFNLDTSIDANIFTKVIRDENIRIGCAGVTFKKLNPESVETEHVLFACNFALENILNFPVYESNCAKVADSCKTGTNDRYPNLCSAQEQYDVNN